MNDAVLEPPTRASLLSSQARVLEQIASGAPLPRILEILVGLIEEQAHGMRCAVLLADARGQRLAFAAAPSIPADYKVFIEPFLRIADNMGSCGTAAFLRRPVYTYDTANDRLWRVCGGIAVRNGLRAIWSTPILSEAGAVLGTFAMYYGEPRLPLPEHIHLIDMAIQMARVAIQRDQQDARDGAAANPRAARARDLQALERLSRRELQVLKLVVKGRTSREIAAQLHLSPKSVDTYRSRIMAKLGVSDLASLVKFAIRNKMTAL